MISRINLVLSLAIAAYLTLAATPGISTKTLNCRRSAERISSHTDRVRLAETLLAKLGYWTGPIDGVLDEDSRQALVAFQKITGRTPHGRLTNSDLEALKSAKKPRPQISEGFHLEIDLAKQVLYIVDEGVIKTILTASTGKGIQFTDGGWTRRAITPVGKFKIERKMEGIRASSLGSMYYPMYINKGVAIHGSQFVAAGPSTHGCIAIPIHAAEVLNKVIPLGTDVIIYGRPPSSRK